MPLESTLELSVIIVTHNNEKEIDLCLEALKQATSGLQSQIIIIDNHSQDKTVELILAKGRSEIYLLRNQENLGFTRGVNQGLRLCQGKNIVLLNPDTQVSATSFNQLIKILKAHPDVGLVAPQLLNLDGTIQPSCRRFPIHRDVFFHVLGLSYLFPESHFFNRWKMGDFDHQTPCEVDQPQGACLMTHRKALDEVGLLDERFPMFFSDVDWCRRFKEKGWRILFYPEAKVIHSKGASVYQNRAAMIWNSHRSFYRYFQKYFQGGIYGVMNFFVGLVLILTAIIRIILHKHGRHLRLPTSLI